MEIEAGVASDDTLDRLACLEAMRSRVIGGRTASASMPSEPAPLHRSLQRAESDPRAIERDVEFSPRFIVLAQPESHQRGRRAELIRWIDPDQTGRAALHEQMLTLPHDDVSITILLRLTHHPPRIAAEPTTIVVLDDFWRAFPRAVTWRGSRSRPGLRGQAA